jgi:protein involved in polysaccharide export with SLBB domain
MLLLPREDLIKQFKKDPTRIAWAGISAIDVLFKVLLATRPYEITSGQTEEVYRKYVNLICQTIEKGGQENDIYEIMQQSADEFGKIKVDKSQKKPHIGIVGEIYVKGMTLQDAQKHIEEQVGQFLPQISITVKFVNNTVSVLGEVRMPGEHIFYRDQITIFQAFSLAGGFSDY